MQKITPRRLASLVVLAALPASAQLLPRPEVLPQPSVPTTAAPLSFEEIFAGVNPAPLTLKVSDLKGEWRLVTIKSKPEVESNAPPAPNPNSALLEAIGAAPGQYVTQGQTVAGGGELFLVAYRMKFNGGEMNRALGTEIFSKIAPNAPFPATELDAFMTSYARERPLELALINVKTLGELSGVRAFNADTQAAAIHGFVQVTAAEEAARNAPPIIPPVPVPTPTPKPPASSPAVNPKPPVTAPDWKSDSLKNLQKLGATLRAYAAAHGDLLPPMATPAQAKTALLPLAGNAPIWGRPDNGEAYRPNPMLSGRKTAHITNPDEFIAFYEATPAPDGTRGVVFLSGKTQRLTSADWPHFQKASKLL